MGSVYNAYLSLSGAIDAEVVRGEKMARRTTYHIGGPAALYVNVHTYPALVKTMEVLTEQGVEWVIMGKGSNVLVSDNGYSGCVITLGGEFARVLVEDNGRITAGAALGLSKLVNESLGHGFSGIEFCAGIPGTVGGAVAMNAGSRYEWISKCIESLVTYCPGKGMKRYSGSELEWGYRASSLPANEIILEVTLQLKPSTKEAVSRDMTERLARRRESQPIGKPSCGSVFRNPPDTSVGKLLEEAGMKGYSEGAAQVSPIHANFIVNNGGATAVDVCKVMRAMQEKVREKYGIELMPEVKFLGF